MSRFTILAVCTANICRSPVMEYLLRRDLPVDHFSVSSAGVAPFETRPIDPDASYQLALRGVDAKLFGSHPLDASLVEAADLIVTATVAHRSAVLPLHPPALRRTFTLLEFADLLSRAKGSTPSELVSSAADLRYTCTIERDIPDPYGRGEQVHAETASTIAEAVSQIVAKFSATLRA